MTIDVGALLRLVRPPNVFTAIADSLAGLLVLWALDVPVPDRGCAVLLVSACLYLSGIVLNDVFDRDIDAVERPTRPIPRGEVSVHFAALLGAGLMVSGVAIAWWIGRGPGLVATALAAAVLAYDGGAKRTAIGPLVMGSCRGLDVALGLAVGLGVERSWPAIAIAGPVVLALYVAALTYMARDEVPGQSQARARRGLVFLLALAGAVLAALLTCPGLPASGWAWPWVIAVLILGVRNWAPLWWRHDGPTTGRAIGGGIVLIPLVDATLCAVAGVPFWAVGVALLVVPALILKQLYSPT
jgi:4-hydroxybenzoate polyprenyltransferase